MTSISSIGEWALFIIIPIIFFLTFLSFLKLCLFYDKYKNKKNIKKNYIFMIIKNIWGVLKK